jgi:hypothetical protein
MCSHGNIIADAMAGHADSAMAVPSDRAGQADASRMLLAI